GAETMHGVFDNQGTLSFNYPNQLGFRMAVQMRIELRDNIFLNHYGLIGYNRNRKLQCLHVIMGLVKLLYKCTDLDSIYANLWQYWLKYGDAGLKIGKAGPVTGIVD